MDASAISTNQELLQQLDEEGILLSDYLMMLVEKTLIERGVIPSKKAEDLLSELS